MNINKILDKKKLKKDKQGIWTTNLKLTPETKSSQIIWEKIYYFNLRDFKKDRKDFFANKLQDHFSYIKSTFEFNPKTIYLEIGCGPSYIGECLMKYYNCFFIGVDFNYQTLVILKNYLEKLNYKKFILIHADINKLPIKSNTIDFIYGGGVIEHFKNPNIVQKELYRVLKKNGIAFNTVPAFNLFWPMSMKKNIPSYPILKQLFEFIHINLLNKKMLNKYHGYELSFGIRQLKNMHKRIGFKSSIAGAFAFHPSSRRLKNRFLRSAYFYLSKNSLISPIIYIAAKK